MSTDNGIMSVTNSIEVPVKFKIPNFCQNSPLTWFALIESTFFLNSIKCDELKFHHTLTSLPENLAIFVIDTIANESITHNKYAALKNAVLTQFTEIEHKQLLDSANMGDDMPSEFFRKLESIACRSKTITPDSLKQIWLNGLPQEMKEIIEASELNDINKILATADKIYECMYLPFGQSSSSNLNPLDNLSLQITELTKKIDKMIVSPVRQTNFTSNSSSSINSFLSRSQFPKQSDMRFKMSRQAGRIRSNRSFSRNPMCYQHYRFGSLALRCDKPCSYSYEPHSEPSIN